MKILFPTDLSDESIALIKRFLNVLVDKNKPAQVEFIHVVEQPVQGATLMVDITKILMGEAQTQMKKIKKSVKDEFDFEIECVTKIGYYETELKDYVKVSRPDMVVVFSKARHGIMKYLSGQRSLKFIGDLKSPLLIIPEDSSLKGIGKIGFAVDKGQSPTIDSEARIKDISEYYGVGVEMVHINVKDDKNVEFYERLEDASDFGKVTQVKKSSVREGIQLWCVQNEIDVLTTVTEGKSAFARTFSGSVTRDLVTDNLLALLVISQ